MGLIFYAGRTAVRSAARNSNRQPGQKPKQWQPLTQFVVIVGSFATAIKMGGAWEAGAITIIVLIVASVLIAIVCCAVQAAGRRNDKTAKPADPLAEFFADKEGSGKP